MKNELRNSLRNFNINLLLETCQLSLLKGGVFLEKWMVRNVRFDTDKFAQSMGISNIVAKLLVNRGIYNLDNAKSFLNSSINELYEPENMLGMTGAVELMKNSIKSVKKYL